MDVGHSLAVKTLAERLAHAMEARQISGRQLAKKTELTAGYISHLKTGSRGAEVSADTVTRLARALEVSFAWLSEGTGSMESEAPARLHDRPEWAEVCGAVLDQHPELDVALLDAVGDVLDDPDVLPSRIDVAFVRDLAQAIGSWRIRVSRRGGS